MGERVAQRNTTSTIIIGLGTAVTAAGRLIGGRIGDGVTGFGLAHIVLGALNMLKPKVK